MSSEQPAILVNNVSKYFEIYRTEQDRVKELIFPQFRRLLGIKEKVYHDKYWALRDVSFQVEKGETVGIIGQNGSGKSTLLQIIMGTMKASSGSVNVSGRVSGLLELGSGFNPEFTGRENVYLNGSLLGLSRKQIDNKFDEIVSFADIGEHLELPTKTYSSGMMLRLAFAVQVIIDTDILIVDEALAVGDARFQLKCFKKLKDMQDNGTSILFVSHSTELIRSFCSKVLVMNKGIAHYFGESQTAIIQYLNFLFPDITQPESDKNESLMTKLNKEESIILEDMEVLFLDKIKERLLPTFGSGGVDLHWVKIFGLKKPNIFFGGEEVTIQSRFSWDKEFIHQIALTKNLKQNLTIGIVFLDGQGRYLFGCNGFDQKIDLNYLEHDSALASFRFIFPFLAEGVYFMTVAIALGTLSHHEQLKWYEAIVELKCIKGEKNVFGTFVIDYTMDYEPGVTLV